MSKHLPLSSAPKTLCILRLSAIGDVTHTIPVIRAIQNEWPTTEITWICGKFEYKLLKVLKGINFIIFDKKAGFKEYIKLRNKLKNQQFEVLLHMQVSIRANLASLAINAKIKLGWDNTRSKDLHHLFINHHIPEVKQQHQTQGFLSFARTLGLHAIEPVWDIPITNNAIEFANNNIDTKTPYIVISACSSHQSRNWQAKYYAQVADYAVEQYGLQVILSGGPSTVELEMAERITALMRSHPVNLVGKDTLEELIAVLKNSTAVISPDSGPAHIANAVGAAVIGLYACTWSKRSGPYNSLNYCVDKFETAAQQFLNQPADSLSWGTKIETTGVMDLITVNDVKKQLDKIISEDIRLQLQ